MITPRLKDKYVNTVVPEMRKEFAYTNIAEVPSVQKIVLNIGMGEAVQTPKNLEFAVQDIARITGQHPVLTKAKKSVASFKLREGVKIGCKVTLRGAHMYYFLDKLINTALPRIRDFHGISATAFDGHGNYTLGLKEQLIFPEIEYDTIDKLRGLEVCIITSAMTDNESKKLLTLMGMPFKN